MKMIRPSAFVTLFALLLPLLTGCHSTPPAVLHTKDAIGYIPIDEKASAPKTDAEQFFVYDVSAGTFLLLEGAQQVIYPASTQKLLTILYARTILEDSETVVPGKELSLLGKNSSVAYIKTYHRLTVEQLIEGMLIPSGNDAALVLAAAAGKKLDGTISNGIEAVSVFVRGMNEYAKELGLVGSEFTDPSGYDNEQYSTLEDMAILALHAHNDPLIMKYACRSEEEIVYQSGHVNHWENTNLCLDKESEYYLPEATGLKTGTLNNRYYNLVISYQVDEKEYIAGFFGEHHSVDRFEDAGRVLEWLKKYC